jgi:hypothetical protein
MKARRPGGNWLRQNYDKLLLVIMLVALLLSTILLVLWTGRNRAALAQSSPDEYAGPKKQAVPTDKSEFDQKLEVLSNPFQVPPDHERMAVGELRVSCVTSGKPIPFEALTCPFEGSQQPPLNEGEQDSDGDGIPDKDEKLMSLNPADPNDARADPDLDGFSTLEEFKAQTVFTNSASHPTLVAKLRFLRSIVDPFRLRFMTITKVPGGDRFALNVKSLDRTYFAKMGETVEGFVVSALETNGPLPVLVLTQGEKTIRLVQGRVHSEDTFSAQLVFLRDATTYKVRIGESVKLPDKSYKVVDIKRDRVVVRDEETGAEIPVLPLSEEERLQLQGGGVQAPPPGHPPGAPF